MLTAGKLKINTKTLVYNAHIFQNIIVKLCILIKGSCKKRESLVKF